MKIVVMGGSGFIGSKLVPRLRQRETKQLPHLPIVVSILLPARDWPKF